MMRNKKGSIKSPSPSSADSEDKENSQPNSTNSTKSKKKNITLSNTMIDKSFIDSISSNPYGRFAPSSEKRSYAVVIPNPQNPSQWSVGHMALTDHINPELDRPLINTSVILGSDGRFSGMRAQTPTRHTNMTGTIERGLKFTLNNSGVTSSGILLPASPSARRRYPKKSLRIFKDEKNNTLHNIKHKQVTVTGADVDYRSNKGKKRRCSQNKIMGNKSAKSIIKIFNNNHHDILTIETHAFLKRVKKAEWLHLIAHSLTPLADDPQQRSNIGAGLSRDNTKMMVIENIAKVLSQYDDIGVVVDAHFTMLPRSEIIKEVQYSVQLRYNDSTLTLYQNINIFSYYDYPRASDQMLLLAAMALLTGKEIQFQNSQILYQGQKGLTTTLSAAKSSAGKTHMPPPSASLKHTAAPKNHKPLPALHAKKLSFVSGSPETENSSAATAVSSSTSTSSLASYSNSYGKKNREPTFFNSSSQQNSNNSSGDRPTKLLKK